MLQSRDYSRPIVRIMSSRGALMQTQGGRFWFPAHMKQELQCSQSLCPCHALALPLQPPTHPQSSISRASPPFPTIPSPSSHLPSLKCTGMECCLAFLKILKNTSQFVTDLTSSTGLLQKHTCQMGLPSCIYSCCPIINCAGLHVVALLEQPDDSSICNMFRMICF